MTNKNRGDWIFYSCRRLIDRLIDSNPHLSEKTENFSLTLSLRLLRLCTEHEPPIVSMSLWKILKYKITVAQQHRWNDKLNEWSINQRFFSSYTMMLSKPEFIFTVMRPSMNSFLSFLLSQVLFFVGIATSNREFQNVGTRVVSVTNLWWWLLFFSKEVQVKVEIFIFLVSNRFDTSQQERILYWHEIVLILIPMAQIIFGSIDSITSAGGLDKK